MSLRYTTDWQTNRQTDRQTKVERVLAECFDEELEAALLEDFRFGVACLSGIQVKHSNKSALSIHMASLALLSIHIAILIAS
jgi:hypothetical protein